MNDVELYAVPLNRFQIDFLLKFTEGILKTPSVRFSKNPAKRELMNSVRDLDDTLRSCISDGPMDIPEEV